MHKVEPTRLQYLSLQFADKVAQFVENNERLLDTRTGGYGYKADQQKQQKDQGSQQRQQKGRELLLYSVLTLLSDQRMGYNMAQGKQRKPYPQQQMSGPRRSNPGKQGQRQQSNGPKQQQQRYSDE